MWRKGIGPKKLNDTGGGGGRRGGNSENGGRLGKESLLYVGGVRREREGKHMGGDKEVKEGTGKTRFLLRREIKKESGRGGGWGHDAGTKLKRKMQ